MKVFILLYNIYEKMFQTFRIYNVPNCSKYIKVLKFDVSYVFFVNKIKI